MNNGYICKVTNKNIQIALKNAEMLYFAKETMTGNKNSMAKSEQKMQNFALYNQNVTIHMLIYD